jgi:organic radical activating enzyme
MDEQRLEFVKSVKKRLDDVGSGFCAMKWLHQTLYLHTGDNHSCYHPKPHHISIDEIEKDPSALHNTSWKKQQRKTMLEGGKPSECYYCWNIENLPGDHLSDRVLHSSSPWAEKEIEKLAQLPWDAPINPKYLEVSFGNNCNFRCGYCCPQASTMWMEEIKEHGNYNLTYNQYGIDFLTKGTYYGPKDQNPYIEAFWKWWPSLRNDLHTLRITGGEPLMNPGAMQFFDLLEEEPSPNLEVSVNSNLGVSFSRVDRLKERVISLLKQKKIKKFSIFSSIDSYGAQAEYMRTGLNCEHWERNAVEIMKTGTTLNLMCTFNVLCVTNYQNLLEKVIEWRKEYGMQCVHLDIPYLKEPPHWMINILTPDFLIYMDRTANFMQANKEYFDMSEIVKFNRVREYMKVNPVDQDKIRRGRRDFYVFFTENDRRLGTDLFKVFPEYQEFYNMCKEVYENYAKN